MNKAQEIEVLREAIAKLGRSSYCGPWLASVIEEVESEIRSDYFASPSVAQTIKICDARVAEAKATAESIIRAAHHTSESIRQDRARIVNGAIAGCVRAITAAKFN